MKPYKHQEEISLEAYEILKQNGLVYISMEERTGKTLTSILIAEMSKANNILVLTKKKALLGWIDTLKAYKHTKRYTVTNHQQAHNISGSFDLIIIDEAHANFSAYPKTGKIWASVKVLAKEKPIIYLSATPCSQGYQLLYNQFRLSSWNPWKGYSNFYDWFRMYGIPTLVRTPFGLQETYTKVKAQVYEDVKHLFISYSRKELGFEHEPEDIVHYISLSEGTKKLYNYATSNKVIKLDDGRAIELDSVIKLRTSLHMLEGGVAKLGENYIVLDNTEKIDAIKAEFGDSEDVVIMYNYIAEAHKLSTHFSKASILQGTSYAEGVDLSMYKHLIIYSQDFSTARYSQRRARQANKERKEPIKVHYYIVEKAISDQVYKAVSINKTNYIDSLYERTKL